MIYTSAIVLAAGSGSRFKSRIPKPLAKINSQPVITYSLIVLERCSLIREIIVVVNPLIKDKIIKVIRKYGIRKVKKIVLGGKRRQDSVSNGLKVVGSNNKLVLIHDAARPFIDKNTVSALITGAQKKGAAIAAIPVKSTIKKVRSLKFKVHSMIIEETIDRNNLWEAQTPQVFKKELILEAYRKFGDCHVTDDAMLVEKLGKDVYIVPASQLNIKLTTPEDLILAEAISRSQKLKVGRKW